MQARSSTKAKITYEITNHSILIALYSSFGETKGSNTAMEERYPKEILQG